MIENDDLFVGYNCDGVVEDFNISPLEYQKIATNIAVFYTIIATGAEYPLAKDTNYTVDIVTDESVLERGGGDTALVRAEIQVAPTTDALVHLEVQQHFSSPLLLSFLQQLLYPLPF